MLESKDPAIRLFGQKIAFSGEPDAPTIAAAQAAWPPVDVVRDAEQEREEEEYEDVADSEAEDDENKDKVISNTLVQTIHGLVLFSVPVANFPSFQILFYFKFLFIGFRM